MEKEVTFNHITLITDGCSNQGISPIDAARKASQIGITVNVLGIINEEVNRNKGIIEIEDIASAGGGFGQIEVIENISKTIQTITRKAITNTIQEVVNNQLSQIFGENNLTSISPSNRVQAFEIIDNIAEYSHLNTLLLIDQSASMMDKMEKIKEVLVDFQLSLQSRAGSSKLCIATFPSMNNVIDIKIPWTNTKEPLEIFISKLRASGNTPTGPAILSSISYFNQNNNNFNKVDGVLDEYIV